MKSLLLIVTAVIGAGWAERACVMKLLRWIDTVARARRSRESFVAYLHTAVMQDRDGGGDAYAWCSKRVYVACGDSDARGCCERTPMERASMVWRRCYGLEI